MNTLRKPVSVNSADLPKSTHSLPDISVTAHSGIIGGLLTVVGRGSYSLPTGGVYILRQTFSRALYIPAPRCDSCCH